MKELGEQQHERSTKHEPWWNPAQKTQQATEAHALMPLIQMPTRTGVNQVATATISPREVGGVPGEAGGGGSRARGPREACFAGWDVGGVPGEAGGGGSRARGPREACFAGWEVGGVPGEAGGGGPRDRGPPRSLLRGVGCRAGTRRSRGRGS